MTNLPIRSFGQCLQIVALMALFSIASVEGPSTPYAIEACCPVPRNGTYVVNADQTVIMIWDEQKKLQHFVRQAKFVSNPNDFGFIVPTPTQPELAESENGAFTFLQELTKPAIEFVARPSGGGCACSAVPPTTDASVAVLERKTVAGFDASVLAADSATDLTQWLDRNGYSFSPAIQAWAQPYIEQGWKFTALKIAAKDPTTPGSVSTEGNSANPSVAGSPTDRSTFEAAALRISFKTDRPLFPYREPDSKESAQVLGARQRLLRIFFVAADRYQGDLDTAPWSGRTVWSKPMADGDRTSLLNKLGLPLDSGPAKYWLTEFEDRWRYEIAPSDLFFSKSKENIPIDKPPVQRYSQSGSGSFSLLAIVGVLAIPALYRRLKSERFAAAT